jgi:hypothetical protein
MADTLTALVLGIGVYVAGNWWVLSWAYPHMAPEDRRRMDDAWAMSGWRPRLEFLAFTGVAAIWLLPVFLGEDMDD